MLKWAVAKDERERRKGSSSKGGRKRRMKFNRNRSSSNGADKELIENGNKQSYPSSVLNLSTSPRHSKNKLQKLNSYLSGLRGGRRGICAGNYHVDHPNSHLNNSYYEYSKNEVSHADSKSLLYMSLDHLPLAIVNQYERMLKEAAKENRITVDDSNAPELCRVHSPYGNRVISEEKCSHNETFQKKSSSRVDQCPVKLNNSHPYPPHTFHSVTDEESKNLDQRRKEKLRHRELVNTQDHTDKGCDIESLKSLKNQNNSNVLKSFLELSQSEGELSASTTEHVKKPSRKLNSEFYEEGEEECVRKPFQTLYNNNNCEKENVGGGELKLVAPLAVRIRDGDLPPPPPPHDTTDPEFLEKSIVYNTLAISRRAKRFTLKRGELRKLERIRNQTERLNRFLKKHYHDCLPNLTEEEEEQCSPEDKSLSTSVLRTHWVEEASLSSPESDTSEIKAKFISQSAPFPTDSYSEPNVRWHNCRNSDMSILGVKDLNELPIIPEDSENSSCTPTSDHRFLPEYPRKDLANSFFTTSTIFKDDADRFGSEREKQHDNCEESLLILSSLFPAGQDVDWAADCRKLKGLSLTAVPLGDSFDVPPCVREEEELIFLERNPPIGSSEKESEEGGDEGPGAYFPSMQHEISQHSRPHHHHRHQLDKSHHCTIFGENEELAHYYSSENETWNSHEYPSRSPCESCETSFNLECSESFTDTPQRDDGVGEFSPNHHESSSLPLSPHRTDHPLPSPQKRSACKKTPKKLVRKAPVKSNFSGKGEVLIHIYKNGDYVTLHVVQAKNLQPSYRSSWKLAVKISVLPEAEETFTRLESIPVAQNRSWVKIDQKLSFEIPSSHADSKVFITFIKRLEKKTSFLGWTTLDLQVSKSTQSWLKLRKRKMSCGAYPASRHHSGMSSDFSQKKSKTFPSPVPTEIETIEEVGRFSVSPESETDTDHHHLPKSQLQNSSTMDSGVEDCCEPAPMPTSHCDDSSGTRVTVSMLKPQNSGFGFSVVWVSPPRIERLEKDKVADLAGLRIGDLIIGVNGQDVTTASNATIYQKMKSTVSELELEVWRKCPLGPNGDPISPKLCSMNSSVQTGPAIPSAAVLASRSVETPPSVRGTSNCALTTTAPVPATRFQPQPPPVSILKPPPPAPPVRIGLTSAAPSQIASQQNNSSWRIRFNIELLDNEDDFLRKFFIQELKFFRKVVSALDRYLIPAQANHLLTPQEIHLIFAHIITIITMTKRILQCIANGASNARWNLGKILHSTHSDHLTELKSAYTSYGTTLGNSAMILSEKMTLQAFARFVIETPVPKGHLDMTSLLFAPFEHLRNLCEISEEIAQNHENWTCIANQLKECYAEIVVQTDFMEPISHISMKKNPLLSVRDLEKRIVLTNCQQALKVSEKGRKWLFGSRLFRREADGSWSPVWAFLFSDCIVLTSHTTRDRVFFVKEPPIRLEDVVTLHFNLPRKNENEFRLLFGPEPQPNRLDKILPIYRNKKSNQAILRTTNVQLKSMWKLLLQRQIITLNTRLSKSSSSNFSISEFCERFPLNPTLPTKDEGGTEENSPALGLGRQKGTAGGKNVLCRPDSTEKDNLLSPSRTQLTPGPDKKTFASPVVPHTPEPMRSISGAKAVPAVGIHSIAKELLKNRMVQIPENSSPAEFVSPVPNATPHGESDKDTVAAQRSATLESPSSITAVSSPPPVAKGVTLNTSKQDGKTSSDMSKDVKSQADTSVTPPAAVKLPVNTNAARIKSLATIPEYSPSRTLNNNNNIIQDFNDKKGYDIDKCPCKAKDEPEKTVEKDTAIVTSDKDLNSTIQKKTREEKEISAPCKVSNLSNSKHNAPIKPQRCTTSTREESTENSAKTMDESAHRELSVSAEKVVKVECSDKEKVIVQQVAVKVLPPITTDCAVVPSSSPPSDQAAAVTKAKPGCKIITNATLRSRQQEVLTGKIQTEKSSDTIITEKSDVTYKTDSTQYQSLRKDPGTIQNFMDGSNSPAFRCHSENGQATAKPKPNKDSPIVSGFGSEKSRRRLLYDYKIKRDYPELFGITPKDRRSFIKKLAVETNEKVFVAPYYYRTYSPIPVPKQPKNAELIANAKSPSEPTLASSCQKLEKETEESLEKKEAEEESLSKNEFSDDKSFLKDTENTLQQNTKDLEVASTTVTAVTSSIEISKIEQERESESENECYELSKTVKEVKEDLSLVDELEEDSEAESGMQDQENQGDCKTSRRSPEESSNDSGISDEITTEKSKSTVTATSKVESFSLPTTSKSECDSVVSLSISSGVNLAANSHATEAMSSVSMYECGTRSNVIEEEDIMELELDRSIQTSRNSSIGLPDGDTSLVDGADALQMALPVAVSKVDKSCGTDDDFHFCWANHLPEKSFRNLMAERREAFFHQVQMGIASSSAASSLPVQEPLIVKIIEGGTVHSTQPQVEPPPKLPVERVLLTRFEKETTAHVERVESSDDSTSSDAASASPAAENGTTDPSWSSSSSSLAGYSSFKEDTSTSHAAVCSKIMMSQAATSSAAAFGQMFYSSCEERCPSSASVHPPSQSLSNGHTNNIHILNGSVHNYYQITRGPEIVVTQESPDTPSNSKNDYSSDGEVDSIVLNGKTDSLLSNGSDEGGRERQELLRVESNDSTAENYGDDDDDDYNFDEDDEEDLSHCSVATINRYGTYESLEKIESEDCVGVLPEFPRTMSRSKARFTFEDDDDDDEDLFEEDFESDFNFRFPTQIQDNTYSVSRLGPLPPLLEEDFEDEMYDEQRPNGPSPGCSHDANGSTLRSRHETGLRRDNSFLLARLATMYARSSISPLKILRELWLKKRYREWAYKE